MSEIFSENAVIDPPFVRGPDANAVSLKNRFGWLREWELAQWRMSNQRETTSRQLPQQMVEPELSSPKLGSGKNNGVWMEATSKAIQNPVSAPVSTRDSTRRQLLSGVKPNTVSPQNDLIINSSLGSTYSPVFNYYGPVNSMLEGTLSPQLLWVSERFNEWEPYLLHVIQTNSGIRVSMRDRRFNNLSGPDILTKVRSELTKHGLRLASLTVNGKEIWQTADMNNEISGSSIEYGILTVDRVY